MAREHFFPTILILFADFLFCSLFYNLLEAERGIAALPIFAFAVIAIAVLLVDSLLCRKEAPLLLYIFLNAGFYVLAVIFGQRLFILENSTLGARVFGSVIYSFVLLHGAFIAAKGDRPPVQSYFDMMLIYQFLIVLNPLEGVLAKLNMLSLAELILLIAASISLRLSTGEKQGSLKGLFGFIFAVLLIALALVFSSLFSESVAEKVLLFSQFVGRIVAKAFTCLMRVLIAIMRFLSSLFPRFSQAEMYHPEVKEFVIEKAVEEKEGNPLIILIFLALMMTALIVMFLWSLRGIRMKGLGRKKGRVRSRRSSVLLPAVRRKISYLLSYISFLFRYIGKRNTPSGLYLWTERRFLLKGVFKKKSESPSEFLRRLKVNDDNPYPGELAEMLDQMFYHGSKVKIDRDYADCYRRSFKRDEQKAR